jgi:histidine triad (HIT) family protein
MVHTGGYRGSEVGAVGECVFCRIVAGSLAASVIHRDGTTAAFMDLRQPGGAHVLVVPVTHAEQIYDLGDTDAGAVMQTAIRVARAMRRALAPAGLSIWQSNGEVAGQEVPHVHMHLLTRTAGDGLLQVYPSSPASPTRQALDDLAGRIRQALEEP